MSEQPPKPASFSESLRPKAAKILQPIGRALIRLHITANMITFFGFMLAAVSGLLAATGNLVWAESIMGDAKGLKGAGLVC